ncbi:M14 family metallopeptidase [Alteribacter natronophilus]|uniref:M14 family metallopeptidase n=1 Tax=Alteribacter natronophilus TaxID=2583810 RepID=UPI00110F01BB|nr:M14 family metallopeptidase [Alteribacter natronophilus]TMW70916.1 DUF2817 domain-containing protein [Alteribacter natronophilus]
MSEINRYFKETYTESRERFRDLLSQVREKWPDAELFTENVGREEDNTIDVIYSEAASSNEKAVFMTSGEHGIEGYTGAAAIHLFVDKYMPKVDSSDTGICLVHGINPWGMRHFRRVTENNVDLNRNYFLEPSSIPRHINENYEKESHIFQPVAPVEEIGKEKTELYEAITKGMMDKGTSGIRGAKSMGQFVFERGVYYGGRSAEPSAEYMKSWQKRLLDTFERIAHMDWHTALGPTNEVTMVISDRHEKEEQELQDTYGMENVKVFSHEDVKGDSTDYFYTLRNDKAPSKKLFSALFEFGTFGTSYEAELREFTTIILENQLYWEGTDYEESREWIQKELMNMFYPGEKEWRESVLREGARAIEAVLSQEGILTSESAGSRS